MRSAWLTVAAWVIGPPAVAAAVFVLGELGSLGWPPASTDSARWLVAADPAVALTAIMRMGVLVGCALTSVRVGAAIIIELLRLSAPRNRRRVAGPGSLSAALRRIARPVAVAGLGVGVASSTAMAHPAAAAARSADPTTAASPAVESPGFIDGDASPGAPGAASSFAEMRRVRIELASFSAHEDRADEREVWVVEPGDHLWSIAFETLTEHLGEAPSERRVGHYWQRLIEANRDRFVIPGEPDVIMPGQRIVLPRAASGNAQRSGT